jgi:hypothetical protein
VLYFLALWIVLIGWAWASPVGSSPDDDYHLPSIWCAHGVSADVCSDEDVDGASLAVPTAVATSSACYQFEATVPGTCADALVASAAEGGAGATLQPTERVNAKLGIYPNGFYSFMHLFVGPDAERSVQVMRVVNGTLAVAALAWIVALARSNVTRAVVVGSAVAWIPLGLSIIPSTNPSSWAFTGLMLLTGMALTLLDPDPVRGTRGWLAGLGAVVGALMAISARVDASVYVAIVVGVVFVYSGIRLLRERRWATTLLVVLALWGVIAYLAAPTPGGAATGSPMGTAERGIGLLLTNVTYVGVYVQGIVGGWPLSWNDVVLPPSIPIIGTLALGAVIALGMRTMSARKAWALALSAAAVVAVPITFLQIEGLGVGDVVQPRYLAPLLLLVVVIALVDSPEFPTGIRWTLTLGLAFSASVAWWVYAHRFAYGSTTGWFDMETLAPYALPWIIISGASFTWLWTALRVDPRARMLR